jgi:hypothetical protein
MTMTRVYILCYRLSSVLGNVVLQKGRCFWSTLYNIPFKSLYFVSTWVGYFLVLFLFRRLSFSTCPCFIIVQLPFLRLCRTKNLILRTAWGQNCCLVERCSQCTMLHTTGVRFPSDLSQWWRSDWKVVYIKNCRKWCNLCSLFLSAAKSLYMFWVSVRPIIRSTWNCNYSLRYRS